MKKVIALLAVCGFAIALVACGKKTEETSTTTADSTTTVETTVAPDSAAHDSTAMPADSAVAK